MGGRIRLSWLEYDVLWEHLGLGPFRPILAVPSPGRTHDERKELQAKAWASLAEKGLGWPDALDGRLQRLLTSLAHPEWELDARMQLLQHGPGTAALIAKTGRAATVAVRNDDELTLWSVPHDQLAIEAVYLLPGHPPGTGNSITLPSSTLDHAATKAGADSEKFMRSLTAKGLGRSESRKLTEVLGNVIRMAHFGAARTPLGGTRHRASHVVSVYDTPQGRYLFTRKKDWVTLVPGTENAIARQLDELLAQLARI